MWWPIEKMFGKRPGEHGFSFFVAGVTIVFGSIAPFSTGSLLAGFIVLAVGVLVAWFGGWLMLVALDRKLGGPRKALKEPWNAMPKPPPPLEIPEKPENPETTKMDWAKWRKAWESVWDWSTHPQTESHPEPEPEPEPQPKLAACLQQKFLASEMEEEEATGVEVEVVDKKKVVHKPVQRILVGGKSKPERVQKKMDAIKEKRQYTSASKRVAKAPRKNRVSSRSRIANRRASRKFVANF